jgi:NTE family protein
MSHWPRTSRASRAGRSGLTCALLALACAAGAAPDNDAVPAPGAHDGYRPRIGLVLSGGGARGAAHIGVLKALEELRIPIDAISGSSMGAVVGGLYAAGVPAAEIENLMTSINWQDAFSDRPSREDLSFRRKQDDVDFPVRIPLGVKGGKVLLPKGLIQGQKLQQVLRSATLPVAHVERFDDLPIPFRALATNLESGEAVTLDHGDLTAALRASMSIPGVFAPVEIDNRVLVDGGVANNLPIEEVRALGAEVIIVSDVSFPLQLRDQLNSPLEISNQMLAIMVRRETTRQRALLGARDLIIEPPLGGASSFDFTNVRSAIAIGERATVDRSAQLSALALSPGAYGEAVAQRQPRSEPPVEIDFVRADERSRRHASMLESTLEPLVGQPLDVAALEQKITELYGLDLFETLDYELVKEGDQEGLLLRARRKSWGPNYVRFALNLQDDFEGNTSFNAAARFIVTELNALGAEWLTDLQVGEHPLIRSEFWQPLTFPPRYFVAPQVGFEIRNVPLIVDQTRIAEFRVRNTEVGLAFGRELGTWGELRAGLRRGEGQSRVRIGDPTLPETDFETGEFFARFSYDELDNVNFPRHGAQFTLQWDAAREGLGDDQTSDILSMDWLIARTFGRRDTVVFWTSAGSTVSEADTRAIEDFFTLGGFLSLSGIAPESIAGPHFGIARLLYYRQIGREGPGFLNVATYAGVSLEVGNTWQERKDASFDSTLRDASVYLGLDTLIGPLYLAAGVDNGGETAFYLFLGRPF